MLRKESDKVVFFLCIILVQHPSRDGDDETSIDFKVDCKLEVE